MSVRLEQEGPDVRVWIKVVPGASHDEIVGVLGDRLKVRTGSPPEGGRANRAVCVLIARRLGVRSRAVSVEAGRGCPEKIIRIEGAEVSEIQQRLAVEA